MYFGSVVNMKILFLDVDGVLNTSRAVTMLSISKPCLRRLKKVITDTGCELVLSSTWRMHMDAKAKLHRVGLRFAGETCEPFMLEDCDDFTKDIWSKRGDEIQKWLNEHPEVTEYVIVDDDGDMLDNQLRHFVQTTFEHGLTETLAYRITYILNNGVRT